MFTIAANYDWRGVHFFQMLPLLLPSALPPFTPTAVTRKITHEIRMPWYTTGFE